MAITNGYAGKYAYLEQYWDKAFKIDTNGVVTTNQTGLLSPYGEFFPTEPGPAALVTMPDIDTGQRGTGIVNVIKLQLDVNHDSVMDLTFGGPDNTSQDRPFTFWVNNDFDRLEDDIEGTENAAYDDLYRQHVPDCEYYSRFGKRMIPSLRDLEDFARLWVCGITSNLVSSLPPGTVGELTWGDKDAPNTNNPAIDLFGAADIYGGIGYLTNNGVATFQTNRVINPWRGRLSPGGSITIFSNNWALTNLNLIWCGAKTGSGALTFTIRQGTNKLAETSAYIELKDIKQMYERWTVGDDPKVAPVNVPSLPWDGLPPNAPPFKYAAPSDTNTTYILLVHDYDLPTWKKDRYAETAFKRLYWQSYQGRFGLFRWPGITNSARPLDDSEFNAWRSARGLLNLLTNLNSQYPGNVYLMAHGYGAIAAGEALRLTGTNQVVKVYIAMQGAVASGAYTPPAAFRVVNTNLDDHTPDRFVNYYAAGAPCYFSGVRGAGAYINYFNTNDLVLTNSWRSTQDTKPDFGYHWDGTNFSKNLEPPYLPPYELLLFPVDTYEIFSYCDEARSEAIGAQLNLGGPFVITRQIDLSTLPVVVHGIGADHSGQFKSFCADEWAFWYAVFKSFGL